VKYWHQFAFGEQGQLTRKVFWIDNSGITTNNFVLPVFYYPRLQEITINGQPAACRPALRMILYFVDSIFQQDGTKSLSASPA
jgi:hypothetical protein